MVHYKIFSDHHSIHAFTPNTCVKWSHWWINNISKNHISLPWQRGDCDPNLLAVSKNHFLQTHLSDLSKPSEDFLLTSLKTPVVLQNIFTYHLKEREIIIIFIEQKALASIVRLEGKRKNKKEHIKTIICKEKPKRNYHLFELANEF